MDGGKGSIASKRIREKFLTSDVCAKIWVRWGAELKKHLEEKYPVQRDSQVQGLEVGEQQQSGQSEEGTVTGEGAGYS